MSKFIEINKKQVKSPVRGIKFSENTAYKTTKNAKGRNVYEIIGDDVLGVSTITWEVLSKEEFETIVNELNLKHITLTYQLGTKGRITSNFLVSNIEYEPLIIDPITGATKVYKTLSATVLFIEE